MIVFAAIVPHPPESIPGVGPAEDIQKIEKTLAAFEELRIGLEKAAPDTVIVISPHGELEPYAFIINSAKKLVGDFSQFGSSETFEFKNDIELAHKLKHLCRVDEMPVHTHRNPLDYGTLIPLHHLTKNLAPKIVQLSFSLMSYEKHFRYGQIIESVIGKATSKRVAILASGELSHRLTRNAPAGFSPEAENFDRDIIHQLGRGNLLSIINMHKEDVDEAAECGIRSIIVMMGAIHEEKHNFEFLSYEGPFGIGYLVARLI
jgi:aromatic ring-opening dioxygenase LigB subunit